MRYNIEEQHKKKKYHAIERINLLLDKDSFNEIGSGIKDQGNEAVLYDGVITGYGKVQGRNVCVFSQDFTQQGGSIGLKHGEKIAGIIKMAIINKCPIVGIFDSGGARITQGVSALAGCGDMMYYNTLASGYIPQISIIVGPCAGAAAYSPAITDFVFCVKRIGNMYITGPNVVYRVTGEKCSAEELGGADILASRSGVVHIELNNEKDCFHQVRTLIDMLPSYCNEVQTKGNSLPDKIDNLNIEDLLPLDTKKTYNVKSIISLIVDDNSFFEIHEKYAQSIVVGFAKIGGRTVGIVANQSLNSGGVLDCDSSIKGARFIRFCDAFHIAVITLVDTPGYLPGKEQEHNGIIRNGAKLLFAYAESTIPKITVILRKAYGGAYIAMGSKHLGADMVYALPNSEIAVMGAEGAVSIIYKHELMEANPDSYGQLLEEKINEYSHQNLNVNKAVMEGYVDEIVDLKQLRIRIADDLEMLAAKSSDVTNINKKHSNIPL